MKFDDITAAIGNFGPYQKRMFVLCCMVGIPAAVNTMVTVFLMNVPPHRCAVPDLMNDTWESQGTWHDELVDLTLPFDLETNARSQCDVYKHRTALDPGDGRNDTVACSRWVYSKGVFDVTVISELNLVCGNTPLVAVSNSILMAGQFAGSLVFGVIADILGRRRTLVIGAAGQFLAALATSFVSNYTAFVVLRFFTTFFGFGMYLSAFVVGVEMVGPKQRTASGTVILLFYSVGLYLVLMLAYLLRDWHHLQIAASLVTLPYFTLYFLVPESARWLVSRGRMEEASAIVRRAAKVNKVDVSEKVLSLQDLQSDGPQEKVWHLFTTPRLLVRCLVIFFNWAVAGMMYYGLGLNVGSLSGDLFLNFLYASIAETLSYVFCLVFLFRIGRRPLHCFTMLLGGVACLAIIFPVLYGKDDNAWTTIVLSMIGKFGISAAFAICYIFTAELFPTMVRNSAIGISSVCARVGSVASPYVADIGQLVHGDFSQALPSVTFGILALLAGSLALCLPETANRKLPDTIEQIKRFQQSCQELNQCATEERERSDANGDAASTVN